MSETREMFLSLAKIALGVPASLLAGLACAYAAVTLVGSGNVPVQIVVAIVAGTPPAVVGTAGLCWWLSRGVKEARR